MTVSVRASEHRAGIGTYRSGMISRWANQKAGARKALAVVVACLFMLQSLVLATGPTEGGKRHFEATTLIAKVFCSAEINGQVPTERRSSHPKCCGLCSSNRVDEDLSHYTNTPTRILSFPDQNPDLTLVYTFSIPASKSATAQILSRSPRAPPYVS